ncbi:MAG: glycosyl transferase family 1 [Candidatus Bathyarchaeota archaeon B24]|nr:MAG: glycosyl transferase family 1 [Candidatus Bathyarchaeota archaeon B24]
MSRRLNIWFVSSYPPRKCGIATFTNSLMKALSNFIDGEGLNVLAVESYRVDGYGPEVKFRLEKNKLESYRSAADRVNRSKAEVVHLQHEFGLFGGEWGSDILEFLERVEKPIVTTFHTVLPRPEPVVWRVVRDISRLSSQVIVMARTAVDILVRDYGVPSDKISFIPHGCPDVPFSPPEPFKRLLGLEGRFILSTFGLLSPGKGIEYAIEALPRLVEKEPKILYIVAGETHPEVKRHQGESYRKRLISLVKKLRLEKHIMFYDKYLSDEELTLLLRATDVYLTPYLGRNQITSGTLTYAMGVGKAIVSTPYLYAVELLRNERGLLCDFENSESIAASAEKLMTDEWLRRRLEVEAYRFSRDMIWPVVAKKHVDLYAKVLKLEMEKTILT